MPWQHCYRCWAIFSSSVCQLPHHAKACGAALQTIPVTDAAMAIRKVTFQAAQLSLESVREPVRLGCMTFIEARNLLLIIVALRETLHVWEESRDSAKSTAKRDKKARQKPRAQAAAAGKSTQLPAEDGTTGLANAETPAAALSQRAEIPAARSAAKTSERSAHFERTCETAAAPELAVAAEDWMRCNLTKVIPPPVCRGGGTAL